ncbi:MAG: NAD(P)-dependent oxidoreductase [DPANN group archaeon]|nr:NAD(P)-dependent oxidoreductase [DPANN group archaeon]
MKILITGATGFIGQNLVMALAKKSKHNISVLVRKTGAFPDNVQVILGNLVDSESLMKATKNIDVIVHLAAYVNIKNRRHSEQTNIIGLENMLKAAKQNKVRHFIFFSTAVITSEIPGVYTQHKKIGEDLVRRNSLPYTIIRPSLVYGQYDNKNFGRMIALIKRHPIVPIVGSGKAKTQPVLVDDLVDVTIKAIEKKPQNKVYFIAGPESITVNEMIKLVANQLGVTRHIIHIPIPIALGGLKFYLFFSRYPKIIKEQIVRMNEDKVYDITAAQNDFGFKPKNFASGIRFLKRS